MLSPLLQEVFKDYNGTLPSKLAEQRGINKESLRKAYLRGDIERPMRGVYLLKNDILDQYFALQAIYSKGIYSHESAMMLLRYGTYTPENHYMTFPKGYHSSLFESRDVVATFVEREDHLLGLTTATTWLGNTVWTYDRERTLLDMLASKHSHPSLIQDMVADYLQDDEKDLEALARYAVQLNRSYLLKKVGLIYA